MTDSVMPAGRFWELIGKTATYEADPEHQVQAMHESSSRSATSRNRGF